MKCTLRKVDGGIVATIDERPKQFDYYYSVNPNAINNPYTQCIFGFERNHKEWHKVIASTIPKVGKELKWERGKLIQYILNLHERFLEEHIGKQHSYTETETQVIIEL